MTPRTLWPSLAVLVAVAAAPVAGAADIGQGVDTLPYLFERATLVVPYFTAEPVADLPGAKPTSRRAFAYKLTVGTALAGDAPGRQVWVCVPRTGEPRPPALPSPGVAFLRPIPAKDADHWWGKGEHPEWLKGAMLSVSGTRGFIPANRQVHPDVTGWVKGYADARATRDPAALLTWAERSVADLTSPVVSRSAAAVAAEVAHRPDVNPAQANRAKALLSQLIQSKTADAATRSHAITALRSSAGVEASPLLAAAAADAANSPAIRRHAAQQALYAADSVRTDPKWSASVPKMVLSAANGLPAYAQAFLPSVDAPPKTAPRIPNDRLGAMSAIITPNSTPTIEPDRRLEVRVAAVAEAAKYHPTEELAKLVETAGRTDKDEAVRVAAVRTLATWGDPASVGRIAKIVVAEGTPDGVSHAGVMAIGGMKSAASREALAQVARTHPEPKFRAVASALAESR